MKSGIGRLSSGMGYGFLAGAAAGLLAGVILGRLFLWTTVGVVAGLAAGVAIVLSLPERRRMGEGKPGRTAGVIHSGSGADSRSGNGSVDRGEGG